MQTQSDGLELLKLMRAGVEYSFTIRVRKLEIKMRPLSSIEMISAARTVMKRMAAEDRTPIEESLLSAIVKLEAASTPEGGGSPALPAAIIEKMTPQEIDSLYSKWLAECERVNPSIETMPTEALEALVEEVKKSPLGIDSALSSRSFTELVNISRHFITRE